ncbi:hypothetical protein ACD661_03530 [Legionella lytica]|uniref:Uncharacterized protein n=1 Tax=Legionella lytica TaxID=96232 RepID=A0ABW8D4K4_9GAMM
MSLTERMVLNYLKKTNPLTAIDNDDVKDKYQCKTGQMPLTISVSKQLITHLINGTILQDIAEEEDVEEEQEYDDFEKKEEQEDDNLEEDYFIINRELSDQEILSLKRLQNALADLPTSLNFQSIYSLMTTGVDGLQKRLLESVNDYLQNIQEVTEHKLLLKAVVLVLKILEYDLSKNPGPITRGAGFFKVEVLSDVKRIENYSIVKGLLDRIIEQYNDHYEPKPIALASRS